MHVDASGAHTILGGIASLRRDVKGVHDHFRVALQHRDVVSVNYNYSVALSYVEERRAAFEVAVAALEKSPDDKFLLERAILTALESGHFTDGFRLCSRWNLLVPEDEHALTHRAQALATAVQEQAFSEGAVQQVLIVLCSVLRDENVRGLRSVIFDDPQEPHSFLYEQHVELSCEHAAKLNAKFVDALVTHPDLLKDPGRSFVIMLVGTKL